MSNSLDPDQAWGFVRPVLWPNCLQRWSSDDSKIRQNKGLNDNNGSLMEVKSIAECSSLWSILQYFWPALSGNQSCKPCFGVFESGHFTQVLLYTPAGFCYNKYIWKVVCCMKMLKSRTNFCIQTNNVNPNQSSLTWVHTAIKML